jgi:hypothetical protein
LVEPRGIEPLTSSLPAIELLSDEIRLKLLKPFPV